MSKDNLVAVGIVVVGVIVASVVDKAFGISSKVSGFLS